MQSTDISTAYSARRPQACSTRPPMIARDGSSRWPRRNFSSSRCTKHEQGSRDQPAQAPRLSQGGSRLRRRRLRPRRGYAAVPDAFARAVYAAKKEGMTNENILVMIQLAGGNDGLRTLVPLADPALPDLRPKLAGPLVSQALALHSEHAVNHHLGWVEQLRDRGK